MSNKHCYFALNIFLALLFSYKSISGQEEIVLEGQCAADWKADFVESVRKFQRSTCQDVHPNADLSAVITLEKVEQELDKYWNQAVKGATEDITYLDEGKTLIFELRTLPEVVFKTVREKSLASFAEIVKRFSNARKIATLLQKNCLDLLVLPANDLLFKERLYVQEETEQGIVDYDCPIIAEEKANVLRSAYEFQWDLYLYCYEQFEEQPWLLEYFKELFRQLTLFACMTGYSDFKPNNIPLDNDGRGVVLVDIDSAFIDNVYGGIVGLCILASPLLYDTIITTASNYLQVTPDYLTYKLSLEFYFSSARLNREIGESKAYRRWLDERDIKENDRVVTLSHENLECIDPLDQVILDVIVKRINNYLKREAEELRPLMNKRRIAFDFLIYDYKKDSELKQSAHTKEDLSKLIEAHLSELYLLADIRNIAMRCECDHLVPKNFLDFEKKVKTCIRDLLSKHTEIFKVKYLDEDGLSWPQEILV